MAETGYTGFECDATTREDAMMQLTGIHHLTAISAKPREPPFNRFQIGG